MHGEILKYGYRLNCHGIRKTKWFFRLEVLTTTLPSNWWHVKVSLLTNILTGLTLTAIQFSIDLILPGQLKVNFSTGAAIKILRSYWMSKFCNRKLYAITKDYLNRSRDTVNFLPCFKPPISCNVENDS